MDREPNDYDDFFKDDDPLPSGWWIALVVVAAIVAVIALIAKAVM